MSTEFDVIGYDVRPGVPAADIADALVLVEAAVAPADPSVALMEVTKCFAVTKSRGDDEMDIQATLAGMVDGLREFPADVIRDGCRAYARCEKWRPSLSELREYCWRRFRARKGLQAALMLRSMA